MRSSTMVHSIFKEAGWDLNASLGGQAFIGIVNMVFTFVAVAVVDRLGRKPLLYIGVSGTGDRSDHCRRAVRGRADQLAAGGGADPVHGVFRLLAGPGALDHHCGDLPDTHSGSRHVGRHLHHLVHEHDPDVHRAHAPRQLGLALTFAMFAVLVAPALLLTWLLIPETKGRSLEEIERSWHHHA